MTILYWLLFAFLLFGIDLIRIMLFICSSTCGTRAFSDEEGVAIGVVATVLVSWIPLQMFHCIVDYLAHPSVVIVEFLGIISDFLNTFLVLGVLFFYPLFIMSESVGIGNKVFAHLIISIYLIIFLICAFYGIMKALLRLHIKKRNKSRNDQFNYKITIVDYILNIVYLTFAAILFDNMIAVLLLKKFNSKLWSSFNKPSADLNIKDSANKTATFWHPRSSRQNYFFWCHALDFLHYPGVRSVEEQLLRICCINYVITKFGIFYDSDPKYLHKEDDNDENNETNENGNNFDNENEAKTDDATRNNSNSANDNEILATAIDMGILGIAQNDDDDDDDDNKEHLVEDTNGQKDENKDNVIIETKDNENETKENYGDRKSSILSIVKNRSHIASTRPENVVCGEEKSIGRQSADLLNQIVKTHEFDCGAETPYTIIEHNEEKDKENYVYQISEAIKDKTFVNFMDYSAKFHFYQNITDWSDLIVNTDTFVNCNEKDSHLLNSFTSIDNIRDYLYHQLLIIDNIFIGLLNKQEMSDSNYKNSASNVIYYHKRLNKWLTYLFISCKIFKMVILPTMLIIQASISDSSLIPGLFQMITSIFCLIVNVMVYFCLKRQLNTHFLLFYFVYPTHNKMPVSRLEFGVVINHYDNILLCTKSVEMLQQVVGKDIGLIIAQYANIFDPFCQSAERKAAAGVCGLRVPFKFVRQLS